jgi:hypothetical protein
MHTIGFTSQGQYPGFSFRQSKLPMRNLQYLFLTTMGYLKLEQSGFEMLAVFGKALWQHN